MLSDDILNYLAHLESTEYWEALFRDHSPVEIEAAVVSLLDGGSPNEVSSTCLFVRDLLLIGHRLSNRSTVEYKSKAVVEALERQVVSAALLSRNEAVYTLGKIGAGESLDFLRRTFVSTAHTDPLMVSRFASEIRWLSDCSELTWLAENTLSSPSYLTRWAAVGVLDDFLVQPGDLEWREKRVALAAMTVDSHPRVCGAAAFLLEEMQFEEELPIIETRAEKKRRRKELERRRPITFNSMATHFCNHFVGQSVESYTVEDLAAFVETL